VARELEIKAAASLRADEEVSGSLSFNSTLAERRRTGHKTNFACSVSSAAALAPFSHNMLACVGVCAIHTHTCEQIDIYMYKNKYVYIHVCIHLYLIIYRYKYIHIYT